MSRGLKTKTAEVINLSSKAIACEAILRNPSTGGINQLVIYRTADTERERESAEATGALMCAAGYKIILRLVSNHQVLIFKKSV
jgi:hypothetical protein